jgi:thiosulfate/3-mercaptopyruvate sulfurtransferase
MPSHPLIDPAALAAALADPDSQRRPAVLDVRWDLQQGPRPDLYAEAHIPTAAFVDLDRALADDPGDRRRGRHPLPDPETFRAAMRAAGVSDHRPVVVYDDTGGTIAARAWWLLRHYGHGAASVLDGGLSAWRGAGRETESGAVGGGPAGAGAIPGDFTGEPGHMPTLDADDAAVLAAPANPGVLLDARAGARYRGELEPYDPAAGHIPGAVNRPTPENLDEDGRFHAPAVLAGQFAALGITRGTAAVGAYCGSGVTAAHEVLALELAGIEAALYPGSWSEWSADPARPVQTGDGA